LFYFYFVDNKLTTIKQNKKAVYGTFMAF